MAFQTGTNTGAIVDKAYVDISQASPTVSACCLDIPPGLTVSVEGCLTGTSETAAYTAGHHTASTDSLNRPLSALRLVLSLVD